MSLRALGDRRTSLLVGSDGSGQSDSTRSTTGGSNGERSGVENEAEHLTLGRTGVSDHEDVDVSTNVGAVGEVLLHTSK